MLQNLIKTCRGNELGAITYVSVKSRKVTKKTGGKSLFWSCTYRSLLSSRSLHSSVSLQTSLITDKITDGEKRIKDILVKTFPNATDIKVQDVSGGCGSMYTVGVQTKEFKGLPIIKQHRLVHEALKTEIKDMHGIQINTATP